MTACVRARLRACALRAYASDACVCVRVRAFVRACVRACVCVCTESGYDSSNKVQLMKRAQYRHGNAAPAIIRVRDDARAAPCGFQLLRHQAAAASAGRRRSPAAAPYPAVTDPQ
ncbi:hypothetical protein EVAR_91900_1 [Eumeta japonica]|uniref:Uncharacterized protein n=1 Tax=Eumeta variegata TaxID=151549 RepID=A0A4C1T0H5_EUMVA|nr:hypothetical protein EVAR_91900_1 [Eumeta japonica]